MAGEDHHQHAERKEHSGERQQQPHADVIEQRTADRDGHGEAEKRQTQHARDHFGGVRLIDGIEKNALQVRGRVGAQSRVDPGHGESQGSGGKQPGLAVGISGVAAGARGERGCVHVVAFMSSHSF